MCVSVCECVCDCVCVTVYGCESIYVRMPTYSVCRLTCDDARKQCVCVCVQCVYCE